MKYPRAPIELRVLVESDGYTPIVPYAYFEAYRLEVRRRGEAVVDAVDAFAVDAIGTERPLVVAPRGFALREEDGSLPRLGAHHRIRLQVRRQADRGQLDAVVFVRVPDRVIAATEGA